ncbi:hypothetical protein UY3_10916, partial [Chelonia mydas]
LLIDIPQDSVNGTVGHSVLLPVSYRLQEPFPFPLSIQWHFSNFPNPLTVYTVTNCSVSAEGIPIHCSGNNFIHSEYQGRTVFFPENASLLLQKLQFSDSGVYRVTFKVTQQTRNITLTVSEPHFNHGNADDGMYVTYNTHSTEEVCTSIGDSDKQIPPMGIILCLCTLNLIYYIVTQSSNLAKSVSSSSVVSNCD